MRIFLAIFYLIGLALFCRFMQIARQPAPKPKAIRTCTRQAPHVCKVNGPCNGLPKPETWQEHWEQELEAEKKGDLLL